MPIKKTKEESEGEEGSQEDPEAESEAEAVDGSAVESSAPVPDTTLEGS